jgi:hypothetical protein
MSHAAWKIVLSRKGFDSKSGGYASPIFPNGRVFSLTIWYEPGARKRYCDINSGVGLENADTGTVIEQLTAGKMHRDALAHLDPDLDACAIPRLPGWRPAFGQSGTQQQHLINQMVGVGDLFLFHGWFREVVRNDKGRWQFRRGAPDLNVIFGWMQVGEVIDIKRLSGDRLVERYPWLTDHPHVRMGEEMEAKSPSDAIYLAADKLRLPQVSSNNLPGAGVFRRFDPRLVLTAPDAPGRSVWRLPNWFKGGPDRPWMTQYPNPGWWTDLGDSVLLRPVGRQGQEAVLDCTNRPEAGPWLASLIELASKPPQSKAGTQVQL